MSPKELALAAETFCQIVDLVPVPEHLKTDQPDDWTDAEWESLCDQTDCWVYEAKTARLALHLAWKLREYATAANKGE